QAVYKEIGRLASTSIPVLIYGEPGTGKQLVARAIHRHGERADNPFVAVDCGSLAEKQFDHELFRRGGVLDQANNGTVFLKSIHEVGLNTLHKLVELIRQKSSPGMRIIAATHPTEVEHRASYDLLHSLRGVDIYIPPLRNRREDIP